MQVALPQHLRLLQPDPQIKMSLEVDSDFAFYGLAVLVGSQAA